MGSKAGFEVVSETPNPGQLRVVGRVPNARMSAWLLVINKLLSAADSAPWNVDISKQYFNRNGKTLYGWRLIFQGENIAESYDSIAAIVKSTPAAKSELTEVTLHAGGQRNSLNRGKGAQLTESGGRGASVGPLAIARARMGG